MSPRLSCSPSGSRYSKSSTWWVPENNQGLQKSSAFQYKRERKLMKLCSSSTSAVYIYVSGYVLLFLKVVAISKYNFLLFPRNYITIFKILAGTLIIVLFLLPWLIWRFLQFPLSQSPSKNACYRQHSEQLWMGFYSFFFLKVFRAQIMDEGRSIRGTFSVSLHWIRRPY